MDIFSPGEDIWRYLQLLNIFILSHVWLEDVFIVVSNAIMTLLVTPPQSFTKSALNLFTLKSSNNQRMIITCHGSLGLSKLILVPARWNSGNNLKKEKNSYCLLFSPAPFCVSAEINDQLIKVSINVCVVRMSVCV